MEYVESVETEKVSLEVYECACGFHVGFDATYLEQAGGVSIVCPACGNELKAEAF